MRIQTNHIKSIIQFFQQELKELYSQEEINNFIFYSFEHYLGLSRTDLSIKANETVSESELLKFNNVVKRLKQHEPVQYILGETWFYGLKLKVDKNVLIPRPETEELVSWVVKEFHISSFKLKILDVGTGSGCIAIALKKNLPQAEVFALDVSVDALDIAKQNAEFNNMKINFIQDDILNPNIPTFQHSNISSPSTPHQFDLILSNPPYIGLSEAQNMSPNVLDYEPHLALFVNDSDPLLFYKAITWFAAENLTEGGKLFFEINESKGNEVAELLKRNNFTNIELKKDLSGKERMIKGEKNHSNS